MNNRFQIRRDSEANWTKVNPLLLEGELTYVIDSFGNVINEKVGNGRDRWNDLPYKKSFSGAAKDVTYQSQTGIDGKNVEEALNTVGTRLQNLEQPSTAAANLYVAEIVPDGSVMASYEQNEGAMPPLQTGDVVFMVAWGKFGYRVTGHKDTTSGYTVYTNPTIVTKDGYKAADYQFVDGETKVFYCGSDKKSYTWSSTGNALVEYGRKSSMTLEDLTPTMANIDNVRDEVNIITEEVTTVTDEVQNISDEEDLTRVQQMRNGKTYEVLQLKDREYAEGKGMGYVILRQDKSFSEQVTKENTIYEIRYDFDLGGTHKQNHTTSEVTTVSYATNKYYYKSNEAVIVSKGQIAKVPDGMQLIQGSRAVGCEYYNRTNSSVTLYAASDTENTDIESVVMSFVDIPDNCILKFEGGSISNGRLYGDFDVMSRGVKIFDRVSFDGDCIYNEYNLDWFVSNKNKTLDLSGTQRDATKEIQMACDSGITLLKISNKYYYYVSSTIVAYSWLTIVGDRRNHLESRQKSAPPCIYTDKDIVVLQIVAQRRINAANSSSIRAEGFSIRRYGITASQANNFNYDIPTVKVITGKKATASYNYYNYAWGVYLDLNLYSADNSTLLKKEGIDDFYAYMNAYTGIEIYASDGGYLTYLEIKGNVYGFRRAYYCHTDNGKGSWITDSRLDFDSTAVYGGDILVGEPVRITGSHQPKTGVFIDETDQCFFKIKGRGVSTAMIWDLGLQNGNLYNVKTPFKKDYDFIDMGTVTLSESWEDDKSILPSNNLPLYRYMDYLHNILNRGGNLLERIFNRVSGWRVCDNDHQISSNRVKGLLGVFNYARLYADNGDYKDINEDTVRNYNSLFKLTAFARATVGSLLDGLSDTFTNDDNLGKEYYKYEASFTIKSAALNLLSKSYFVALCHHQSCIRRINFYAGEELIGTRNFDVSHQYYSESICVPLDAPSTSSDLTIVVSGEIRNNITGRVLPKIGILTRDTSNVITSSGGEIVGRLALSDVLILDNHKGDDGNIITTRYLNNKYLVKNLKIAPNYWAFLLCMQSTYNYNVIVEYITSTGRIGTVNVTSSSILTKDPYLSFKLSVNDSTSPTIKQLEVKSTQIEYITVTSVYCACGIKFMNKKDSAEFGTVIENIHRGIAGTTSQRPTDVEIGSQFFDTILGKPIYVKNIVEGEITWVDATGAEV